MNSNITDNSTPQHPVVVLPQTDEISVRNAILQRMKQGVVCVDRHLQITIWNRTMSEMTGLTFPSMHGRNVSPSLLGLFDAKAQLIPEADCPFLNCLAAQASFNKTYFIRGRSGRALEVIIEFHPILDANGAPVGAMALVEDTSAQLEMHKQLSHLYRMAVLDPLTQIANRAEFERLIEEYITTHREADLKCSIIVADIDFFKSINDNFGHHVGDQALIAFAKFLKQFVRKHDLVARFGGEEFVILCANCDEANAVERAEEIRFKLEKTPQPSLDGKCLTASFGVSQLEDSDDSTSLFVRADHALLRAKELGRNRVVGADQENAVEGGVGSGSKSSVSGAKWRPLSSTPDIFHEFQTQSPSDILAERIRCLIPEMNANVIQAKQSHVTLQAKWPMNQSKQWNYEIDIDLVKADSDLLDARVSTLVRVAIRQQKGLFTSTADPLFAEQIMQAVRQYLALTEENSLIKIDAAVTSSTRDTPPAS